MRPQDCLYTLAIRDSDDHREGLLKTHSLRTGHIGKLAAHN